jgi:hypothetical protein
VTVRFTPCVTGPITLFGVCELEGAQLPCGFRVTSQTRGLDVMYELLSVDQYAEWREARSQPRALKRKDDVDLFKGMSKFLSWGGGGEEIFLGFISLSLEFRIYSWLRGMSACFGVATGFVTRDTEIGICLLLQGMWECRGHSLKPCDHPCGRAEG